MRKLIDDIDHYRWRFYIWRLRLVCTTLGHKPTDGRSIFMYLTCKRCGRVLDPDGNSYD